MPESVNPYSWGGDIAEPAPQYVSQPEPQSPAVTFYNLYPHEYLALGMPIVAQVVEAEPRP